LLAIGCINGNITINQHLLFTELHARQLWPEKKYQNGRKLFGTSIFNNSLKIPSSALKLSFVFISLTASFKSK
jgi:hypothetical protein